MVWTSSAVEEDKNKELDFPLFPLHLLTESVLSGGICSARFFPMLAKKLLKVSEICARSVTVFPSDTKSVGANFFLFLSWPIRL